MGKTLSKIIITGHPYAFPYYFKVFEFLKNKDEYIFVLPDHWEAKNGKVKIDLKKRPGFEMLGSRVVSYGGRSMLAGLFKGWMPAMVLILARMRFKYGPGVLYSCSEPNLLTTLYNGLFTRLFGHKHVVFTWQNVYPEKRMSGLKLKLSNALVRSNLALADGVICGNSKAEEIVRNFNPEIKTLVCPLSGVDVDKFNPNLHSSGTRTNEKTILFYGALEERKGVGILLDAVHRLSDLDFKLIIIGAGPEEKKLKSKTESLKLGSKVIFKDWMKNDELPKVLNGASVFVYPSMPSGGWEEQFGYAMGEASASEVPVVATKTGSINEVVKDGETGILVKAGDAEELKNALLKLLTDDELRKKMGQAGREYIIRNFSHNVVAEKISIFLSSFN